MSRPVVSVFNSKNAKEVVAEVRMPHVFMAPVRNDIVSFVHDQLSKNTRQAIGVDKKAGMKHSAESWGTGRAVARIPRVSGSGTHRSGQGAFGNMCRKGRMAHPLKTWRRWHRKVNVRQRRHALASAVAATACAPLVMARGHRVMNVPQLPLILDDSVGQVSRTKEVIALLKNFGCYEEVRRVISTQKLRPGIGKIRNRRHKTRRGMLFVVNEGADSLKRATRNLPGVDFCNVNRMNIRSLAPGGHLGRFCIWTQSAFTKLESIFGSGKGFSSVKKGYKLRAEVCSTADVSGLINSDAIQKVLRVAKPQQKRHNKVKNNSVRNAKAMAFVNPYSKVLHQMRQKSAGQKTKVTKAMRTAAAKRSKASRAKFLATMAKVEAVTQANTDVYKVNITEMNV